MKGLIFLGRSLQALQDFSPLARHAAGDELRAVQRGLEPSDWKSMPIVGPGAKEIRIHVEGAWRIIYVAKFADAVYVLHCFRKKSWKTAIGGYKACAEAIPGDIRIMKARIAKARKVKGTLVKPTDNLFKVLGFPDGEADVMLMRSDLMADLRIYIRDSGLTQAEVAKKLGITQSRVSDLVRGKWEKFNLEMLITLEGRLGRKVSLKLVA